MPRGRPARPSSGSLVPSRGQMGRSSRLQEVLTKGQYSDSDGLFFGGRQPAAAPSHTNGHFRQIFIACTEDCAHRFSQRPRTVGLRRDYRDAAEGYRCVSARCVVVRVCRKIDGRWNGSNRRDSWRRSYGSVQSPSPRRGHRRCHRIWRSSNDGGTSRAAGRCLAACAWQTTRSRGWHDQAAAPRRILRR